MLGRLWGSRQKVHPEVTNTKQVTNDNKNIANSSTCTDIVDNGASNAHKILMVSSTHLKSNTVTTNTIAPSTTTSPSSPNPKATDTTTKFTFEATATTDDNTVTTITTTTTTTTTTPYDDNHDVITTSHDDDMREIKLTPRASPSSPASLYKATSESTQNLRTLRHYPSFPLGNRRNISGLRTMSQPSLSFLVQQNVGGSNWIFPKDSDDKELPISVGQQGNTDADVTPTQKDINIQETNTATSSFITTTNIEEKTVVKSSCTKLATNVEATTTVVEVAAVATPSTTSTDFVIVEKEYIIKGFVAKGYERVYEEYENNFQKGDEECSQCCIYVKGEKVVDLWGSFKNQDCEKNSLLHNYNGNSLQNVFSSTKAISSLVIAMLVDRGHLDYDQLVSDIWPGYKGKNKELTTIKEVMRHEAGLYHFDTKLHLAHLQREQIKNNSMSGVISLQAPRHRPGRKRMYHAVTRGFIINEIVRRADPQKRTVGEFVREEIALPLGLEDEMHIGLAPEKHQFVAPVRTKSVVDYKKKFWANKDKLPFHARAGEAILIWGVPITMRLCKFFDKSLHPFHIEGMDMITNQNVDFRDGFWNHADVRSAEIPSANGHCTARALAVVANCLAQGGVGINPNDGSKVMLLSKKGYDLAHDGVDVKRILTKKLAFNNAGWCDFAQERAHFVGWMGYGGSVFQWNKEHQIGFGYAMNLLSFNIFNYKGERLQRVALECVMDLEKDECH